MIGKMYIFAASNGAIAQLVEQRTENPCVPRSIRGGTTDYEYCQFVTFYFTFAYR